jgi:hypothetical protein
MMMKITETSIEGTEKIVINRALTTELSLNSYVFNYLSLRATL